MRLVRLFFSLEVYFWQVGHNIDHFTSPEGIPGVAETNFNNRPNSFRVLSPPRTSVVCFLLEILFFFFFLKWKPYMWFNCSSVYVSECSEMECNFRKEWFQVDVVAWSVAGSLKQ